jgi:hypothetical protein
MKRTVTSITSALLARTSVRSDRRNRQTRLRFESLEDRVVPSAEFDPADLWLRDSSALYSLPPIKDPLGEGGSGGGGGSGGPAASAAFGHSTAAGPAVYSGASGESQMQTPSPAPAPAQPAVPAQPPIPRIATFSSILVTPSQPPAATKLPVVTMKVLSQNDPANGGVGGFLVSRNGTTGDLVIHYRVLGNAKPGLDYVPLSGTVTITDGNKVASVPLDPLKFDHATGARTVTLWLVPGDGYKLAPKHAGTVRLGRFSATPVVSVEASVPAAGRFDNQPGYITFTRTTTAGNLRVDYATHGTAEGGTVYQILPGSVVIRAGETTATILSHFRKRLPLK